MSRKTLQILAALAIVLSGSSIAEAKTKKTAKASFDGCQISRKGTKIRCPHGLFIRQDVVDRKIATVKSGAKKKKSKK